MKIGDKIYCVKNYINSYGECINNVGKYYYILSVEIFSHNQNEAKDIVFGVTCNTGGRNVFWLKYQYFDDIWDDFRKKNLIDDYFISETKLREEKLKKLYERI